MIGDGPAQENRGGFTPFTSRWDVTLCLSFPTCTSQGPARCWRGRCPSATAWLHGQHANAGRAGEGMWGGRRLAGVNRSDAVTTVTCGIRPLQLRPRRGKSSRSRCQPTSVQGDPCVGHSQPSPLHRPPTASGSCSAHPKPSPRSTLCSPLSCSDWDSPQLPAPRRGAKRAAVGRPSYPPAGLKPVRLSKGASRRPSAASRHTHSPCPTAVTHVCAPERKARPGSCFPGFGPHPRHCKDVTPVPLARRACSGGSCGGVIPGDTSPAVGTHLAAGGSRQRSVNMQLQRQVLGHRVLGETRAPQCPQLLLLPKPHLGRC